MDAIDVLTACALRFDGHAYSTATGFDRNAAIEVYFETGAWPEALADRLALFYLLQRALCKWELFGEPHDGRYWRAFRTLFFEVCEADVPEAYRVAHYADHWDSHYAPRLSECLEAVWRAHVSR
jgi:hypothetical protein